MTTEEWNDKPTGRHQITHPTDEELDALVGKLDRRVMSRGDNSKRCYTIPDMDTAIKAISAITTLRTQLAEANARADRAEAALAAQIEADAGIARHRHAVSEDAFQKGLGAENRHCALEAIHIADKIADQPHDRSALDRMQAEAREKALREAALVAWNFEDGDRWTRASVQAAILQMIEVSDDRR